MNPLPGTLPELLDRSVLIHPGRLALVMRVGLRDDRWSYARLQAASHAIATAALDVGLGRGDRVLIQAPNSPDLVAAMFGSLRAGLVLVPLDLQAPPEVVDSIARSTDAAAIITAGIRPPPSGVRSIPLESLRDAPAAIFTDHPVRPDDLAEVVFTSGTTGHPKGVQLTHGNIASNVRSAGVLPHGPGHRLVSLLPLSHMLEQTGGLFFPLSSGGSIAYATSRQSSAILRELRARRPTTLVVVPQLLELLLGNIERDFERLGRLRHWRRAHRIAPHLPVELRRAMFLPVHQALGGQLRWVFSGGAALPATVGAAWEQLGVMIMQGYGATECAPFVSCNRPGRFVPGSIGHPLPGIRTRLDDDGELLVQGPNVTPGYWRDDAATREVLADGWYRTGDLARVGDRGELYLLGRKRELIALANGMNVFPSDVESALNAEAIHSSAVVGWSPTGAPAVHAVIVPREGAGSADLGAAIRAANGRLTSHARITGWTVWPGRELPRTNTLKVRKQVIVDWLNERRQQSVEPPGAPAPADGTSDDRLLRLLERATSQPAASITPETDLAADLGLDSLGRVELAVAIEQELGVQLSDEAIGLAITVAELQALLTTDSAAAPPDALMSWPWTRPAIAARALVQRALLFRLIERCCRPLRVEPTEALLRVPCPALLIANHTSHLDAPLVLRALPEPWRRRTAVAAARDYFFRNGWLGAFASLAIGAFPLAREGPILPSLEACGRLIDRGWSVLVFPEGTRSADGRLQSFKPGIGLLARELHVPIVPIAIVGAHSVLPKGSQWPISGPVIVTVGKPLAPDLHRSPEEIGHALHDELAALLAGNRAAGLTPISGPPEGGRTLPGVAAAE